jgi:tetratricopeptide (TPR) repeat protein
LAVEDFVPRIKDFGNGEIAKVSAAQAFLTQGDDERALLECDAALRLNPRSALSHLLRGWILAQQGKYEPATAACQKALQCDPAETKAHLVLGLIWLERDRYDAAEAELRIVTRESPEDAFGHMLLADVLIHERRWAEAEAELEAALELNRQLTTCRYKLALVKQEMGKLNDAIADAEAALRLNAHSPRSYLVLGDLYFARQNYEEALDQYLRATDLGPTLYEGFHKAGMTYARLQQQPLAIAQLRQALSRNPLAAESHFVLGNVLADIDAYEEALAEYRLAFQIDKRFTAARDAAVRMCELSGDQMLERGRGAQAIARYELALQLDPLALGALQKLGEAHYRLGDHAQAEAVFRRALEADDTLVPAHYMLGKTLLSQGRRADAAAELEAALRLDPGHAAARIALADTRADQRGLTPPRELEHEG